MNTVTHLIPNRGQVILSKQKKKESTHGLTLVGIENKEPTAQILVVGDYPIEHGVEVSYPEILPGRMARYDTRQAKNLELELDGSNEKMELVIVPFSAILTVEIVEEIKVGGDE